MQKSTADASTFMAWFFYDLIKKVYTVIRNKMKTIYKYYKLRPAVDTPETGNDYPAVESIDNYDFNSPNSVYKLDSSVFPDFTPDIRYKLAKRAKLCDIMEKSNISACGLLISERVKTIFESANLIPHKYYLATIENKDVIFQYYWTHFVWENAIKYLDFKNSKFKIKRASKDLGEIEISDYEDLLIKQSELGYIKMIHNYESTMYQTDLDLFIHPLNKTIYISEKLMNTLLNEKITGADITPADNLTVLTKYWNN